MEQILFKYKDSLESIRKIEVTTIFEDYSEDCLYTIAIPTFKRVDDLLMTLNSAINQKTDIPYNIIVVDNNPERNDETEVMMKEHYHQNLSYYKNSENIGMAGNWNRLFLLCKTKYMIMLHDDDCLYSCFVESMHKLISKDDTISVINGGKQKWNGSNVSMNVEVPSKFRNVTMKKGTLFFNFYFGPPSGCLFNVADVLEIGGVDPESYPSIDYVLIQKLILAGKKLQINRNELMLYRIVGNTTSKIETQIKWVQLDEQIKDELGEILKLPNAYIKFIKYMVLKFRILCINKIQPDFKYKNFNNGGNLTIILFKSFQFLYKLYYNLL